MSGLRVVRDHVRSSHFVGEPDATIRVGKADASYGRAGAVHPPGALLVVSHATERGPIHFVMERPDGPAASAWDYAIVDAEGWVVARGRIPTCVRCHQEAPIDEVFGPSGL